MLFLVLSTSSSDAVLPTTSPEDHQKTPESPDQNSPLTTDEPPSQLKLNTENFASETGKKRMLHFFWNILLMKSLSSSQT